MSNCKKSKWVFGLCLVVLSGCATIVNKDIVSVPVYTEPPGARLFVAGRAYVSPDIVKVPRGQGDFVMTVEKPGYHSERVLLRESLDIWPLGNLIGPGSFIDDLASKRAFDLEPEQVNLTLRALTPSRETP